ncbi:MAG: glutathione S-transferase family protein [Acetobacteraceae bacterium]
MDSTIKLYGSPQSRAARCLWMARELNLPVETIAVAPAEASGNQALRAVNPNGRVPGLDDNGFHLFESLAINVYLAKKYGAGKDFVPSSLEDDARTTQWTLWAATEIEKPLLALLLHTIGRAPLDEAGQAAQKDALVRPLTTLNGCLASQDYLLGGKFTVADLNVASVLRWAQACKLDLSAYPKVVAWLDRCLARPAAKG